MASPVGRVAVVTVTYNSGDDIEPFLTSARAAGADSVVVSDNPSPQSATTIERAERSGARVVRMPSNVGYGGGVNAAVATLAADIDAVLISNPDVRLTPDAIRLLAQTLAEDPQIGAVGPEILNDDGTVYPSARRVPSLRTGVGHALFFRVWPRNPWTRAYRQEDVDPTARRDVGWLSGACLLVRRTAFDDIGGFDERYFMYFEDVDLGYRLGKAGWRNLFEPAARVLHSGGKSTASLRPQMLIAHHRSADRFLASKYPGRVLAPLRFALHVGLDLRARWLTRGMLTDDEADR
ncbi:MAG TPA: glycosyltransferase family 2 protein [Pseudolysinimonas sp.]|jgi:N-acetylglucosaminyl-diphospho-decaprenol L-rhamnosyltransferase|nr:glycosyltransferase family 2 protein [Pseudolysinimonas sp.]